MTPPLTQASGVLKDMRKMQPAGQRKRSPGRRGRGVRLSNVMTEGVDGARNSSAMVSEEVDVSVTPPVGEVGSFLINIIQNLPGRPTCAAGFTPSHNTAIM